LSFIAVIGSVLRVIAATSNLREHRDGLGNRQGEWFLIVDEVPQVDAEYCWNLTHAMQRRSSPGRSKCATSAMPASNTESVDSPRSVGRLRSCLRSFDR
jgi:hypothetical protein